MKCFVIGGLGAMVIIIFSAFIFAQYSDYRGLAETRGILVQIEPIKQAIEAAAIRQKSFLDVGKNFNKSSVRYSYVDFISITNAGMIIVKGGRDGQIIVLSPSFIAEKIIWHCIGGPAKDMPSECKSQPSRPE